MTKTQWKRKQLVIGSAVTVVLATALVVLMLVPMRVSGSIGPIRFDKVYHFAAFFFSFLSFNRLFDRDWQLGSCWELFASVV